MSEKKPTHPPKAVIVKLGKQMPTQKPSIKQSNGSQTDSSKKG